MRADQLEEAVARAERALALTRERGERGLEAWALWLLGEIASRRETPDVEGAEGHYRGALALAAQVSLSPLIARCHDGLARLYRHDGRAAADQHLATAVTMYREMDMKLWLGQAEAALASPR